MENFILDVSKSTDADAETTRQFRVIIQYYRKLAQTQMSSNPKIKALFDKVNESFKQLDKGAENLNSKKEETVEEDEEVEYEEEQMTPEEQAEFDKQQADVNKIINELVKDDMAASNTTSSSSPMETGESAPSTVLMDSVNNELLQ